MKRRSLLVMATLAGGGLVTGCASPARQQLRRGSLATRDGQVALNGWVKVGTDGLVTVVAGKSEMGQGVHTALMMLVAEEMDCAWGQMRLEHGPVDPLYGNVAGLADGVPFRADDTGLAARSVRWVMTTAVRQCGFMMTGGSSSIRDLWLPMRQAAAATRATLVEAVALQWQVAPADVRLSEGVFSGPRGRSLGLGEAVRLLGVTPRPAEQVRLKEPAQFKLIGQPLRRTDAAAKADGSATFGIDVRPPGLLHAAVRMAPVRGGRVKACDASQARALAGVAGVVVFEPAHGGSGGVAVVADAWWRAAKALDALQVQFEDGPLAGFSSAAAADLLARKLDTEDGFTYWKLGDAKAAIQASPRNLEAEYRAPYLAHATMEPMNCTVQFNGDSATVWAPTQVPGFARRAAAKALGLDEHKVEMNVTYLGGGFGRRLEADVAAQAATIARQFPGKPVQVLWSREDDLRHDFYRPACVARLAAALNPRGQVAAWRHVSAGQAIVHDYMPRNAGLPMFGPDKTTAEGAFDASYEFPAVRVGHVTVDLPVPVGFWRSVGHSHQAFFKESFLDECAHAAGADPLAYRRALLASHPRQRAVLDLVAAKSGWGSAPLPAADGAKKARGVALHESFGSTIAQVAEVSMGPDGTIRVHRVTCAIDCGIPVNPNLIAQQIEGSVVFGLTAALHGRIDIAQGRVQQGNFHEYAALRITECPVIETHIVPSARPPEGVGEPGVPPIAPAVANAVFTLTGRRLRSLSLAA
ncbi:MAG TPA: molybdopterin cofactor-binding domain-containing protein [Burkholderiaceae bacterium]|nr:molybdopterin cofactor-binding domain-containing protein [Burkholderiaceae bacterium]